MASSTQLNLKKVALKKSFSAKSFASEPEIGSLKRASRKDLEGLPLRPGLDLYNANAMLLAGSGSKIPTIHEISMGAAAAADPSNLAQF